MKPKGTKCNICKHKLDWIERLFNQNKCTRCQIIYNQKANKDDWEIREIMVDNYYKRQRGLPPCQK